MVKGPTIEALKEIGRWVLLFVASWLITETINQITVIPETLEVKIWVFAYLIPIRLSVKTLLTLVGRFVDKLLHERGKAMGKDGWLGARGITYF